MSNSDTTFRERFINLIQTRKEMSPEQLTSEDDFDNIIEGSHSTE